MPRPLLTMKRNDSAMDTSELLKEPRGVGEVSVREGLKLHVLGVRCSSGMNALDFAFVRYRQRSPSAPLCIDLLKYSTMAVPTSISHPILNLLCEAPNKPILASRINAHIGQMFSDGIKSFCQTNDIKINSIDFVGTHTPRLGQNPSRSTGQTSNHPLGWNINILADTGVTVVSDFSVAQRTSGRMSTSPVAFVDRIFLQHPDKFRACFSIEELVNISFIPPNAADNIRSPPAFNCGPGSLFTDYAMRYCTSNSLSSDNDGKFAAKGKVNQAIVDRFLDSHDYLRMSPSINISREMFGDHEAQRLIDECLFADMCDADTVATITRVTAQNILKQYRRLLEAFFPQGQQVDEIIICGPGARNANIIDYLEAELPESVITRQLDDIGIPGDANEAVCYAQLALEAVLGQTTHSQGSSSSTPVQSPDEIVRARIMAGEGWEQLVERIQKFSNGKPLRVSKIVDIKRNIAAGVEMLDLQ